MLFKIISQRRSSVFVMRPVEETRSCRLVVVTLSDRGCTCVFHHLHHSLCVCVCFEGGTSPGVRGLVLSRIGDILLIKQRW